MTERQILEWDFDLAFELPCSTDNPESYLDDLYESGCDDALIGIGRLGRIGFSFNRASSTPFDAIISALSDIYSVIPDSKLIKITFNEVEWRVGLMSQADIRAQTIAIAKGEKSPKSTEPRAWFPSIHALQIAGKEFGLTHPTLFKIINDNPDHQAAAAQMLRIYIGLFNLVSGDRKHIEHWINTKNKGTGGIPGEQLKTTEGRQIIEIYLDRMANR